MRPVRPGVALAAPLLLLAVACGSQQAGTFHPAGVVASASAQPSATPSGPVPFPGKVKFEFDALPSDPAQAALVSTDRDFLLAYYDAIYTRGKNKGYRSYIANNGVATSVRGKLSQLVGASYGFAGVDKHFDTTVTSPRDFPGDMYVNYCNDEAGLQFTDIKTGRLLGNGSPPGEKYYYESDLFAPGKHGTWELIGTLTTPYPHGKARECKP
jgi:hypothetical protein